MMNTRNWETSKTLKVAVLGEGSVGKTTISKQFSEELTDLNQISMTKGVDISVKNIVYKNTPIAIQIWDFAGQKQFRFMIDIFLKGVRGIIYVYDVTDVETLFYLHEFVDLVRKYFMEKNYQNVPEILVGNKVDLGETEVTIEDVHEFMNIYNITKHFLVSGIYGENVSQPFEYLISQIIDNNKKLEFISPYSQIQKKGNI
ncbi:MAG: Rab family GTPase [Candidatus Heimdallarchaeaceae archaeon]